MAPASSIPLVPEIPTLPLPERVAPAASRRPPPFGSLAAALPDVGDLERRPPPFRAVPPRATTGGANSGGPGARAKPPSGPASPSKTPPAFPASIARERRIERPPTAKPPRPCSAVRHSVDPASMALLPLPSLNSFSSEPRGRSASPLPDSILAPPPPRSTPRHEVVGGGPDPAPPGSLTPVLTQPEQSAAVAGEIEHFYDEGGSLGRQASGRCGGGAGGSCSRGAGSGGAAAAGTGQLRRRGGAKLRRRGAAELGILSEEQDEERGFGREKLKGFFAKLPSRHQSNHGIASPLRTPVLLSRICNPHPATVESGSRSRACQVVALQQPIWCAVQHKLQFALLDCGPVTPSVAGSLAPQPLPVATRMRLLVAAGSRWHARR
nr:translation initiation factor IF-2-like [Aegilops tauschii subsp. strangulata]